MHKVCFEEFQFLVWAQEKYLKMMFFLILKSYVLIHLLVNRKLTDIY
jgi:hypothetical protein